MMKSNCIPSIYCCLISCLFLSEVIYAQSSDGILIHNKASAPLHIMDTQFVHNVISQLRAINTNTTMEDNIAMGSGSLKSNIYGNKNIAFGQNSLKMNMLGMSNIAMGLDAQKNSIATIGNISIGQNALVFNQGFYNLAIGNECLQFNETGNANVGFGIKALMANKDQSENCSFGYFSMNKNLTGYSNTAFGNFALGINIQGHSNTALGSEALFFSNDQQNTGVGIGSLALLQYGSRNTGVGVGTFSAEDGTLNVGDDNVAIGDLALGHNLLGNGNTAIGHQAMFSPNIRINHTAVGFLANCISSINAASIGFNALVSVDNRIRIGNTSVTKIEGNVNFTISDARFKNNVSSDAAGLRFILKLNPVTYNFDYWKYARFINETEADSILLVNRSQQVEIGLIAQEVELACNDLNLNYANLIYSPKDDKDYYTLSYATLVIPILKAVKEQQTLIEKHIFDVNEFEHTFGEYEDKLDMKFQAIKKKIEDVKRIRK